MSSVQKTPEKQLGWKLWIALIILSLSSFMIVTTELAPIGLMSALAHDLHQTEGIMGLIVTGYGWIAAISALCSVVLLARFPRKPLLVILMLVLAVSNLIVAHSQSFMMIFLARAIGAIAHGGFWALIGSIAYHLVPKEKLGLATSIIFSGVSVASVLGVPFANWMTQLQGWQLAFNVMGIAAVLVAFLIVFYVPKISQDLPPEKGFFADVLQHPSLKRLFSLTALIISAHFAAFTFIEPFLVNVVHLPINQIALLLLIFGVSGLIGNILAAKWIDQYLFAIVMMALVGICLSLLGLVYIQHQFVLGQTISFLILWGASIAALFVGLQTWVLKTAAEQVTAASAIYVAIFNASIGFGALVGGILIQASSLRYAFQLIILLLIVGMIILMNVMKYMKVENK